MIHVGVRSDDVVAAAHLTFRTGAGTLDVFIPAAGSRSPNAAEGAARADRLLAQIHQKGRARATDDGCSHLVLSGKIHKSNTASQLMVLRARWEPADAPDSSYQTWGLVVPI